MGDEGEIERRPKGFAGSFSRNALTSLFTTALDIAVLTALVELGRVNLALATGLGTVVGCLSNFWINRRWSFRADGAAARWQLVRFLPVQVGSSAFQTWGVWLLALAGGKTYLASKVAVSLLVYGGWNYPMNRLFVFPRRRLAG